MIPNSTAGACHSDMMMAATASSYASVASSATLLMGPGQVINNPVKAEEYLDLAEDIEDANAMKVASRDAVGRLVLLGAGQSTDASQEQVSEGLGVRWLVLCWTVWTTGTPGVSA
jgi:hypothetical protein